MNVTEPSGGVKDVGWRPGLDGVVGPWWNWLHWMTGVFFRYIENTFRLGLVRNHVMAGAPTTEAVVTNGAGMSVNVSAARVWILGAMYSVPASVNLALAASDPTDDRLDLVVARLVAGAPAFARITGTPDPDPVAPDPLVGDVPLYWVRVIAAAVGPGQKTDVREFGAWAGDGSIVGKLFRAGDDGSGAYMFEVVGINYPGGAYAKLGRTSDPSLQVNFSGAVLVKPEEVTFFTAITRKFDIGPSDFRDIAGGSATYIAISGVSGTGLIKLSGSLLNDIVHATARVPNGATITAVRAQVSRDLATSRYIRLRLYRVVKISGVWTQLAEVTTVAATGDLTIEVTGLAEVVDQASIYVVEAAWVLGGGADVASLYCAEVVYTELNPFNGL